MLTAHLPSGYLLARTAERGRRPVPGLLTAALVGAVLPDLDLVWFHFVDHASVHHHRYWPHIPLVWLGIALVTLSVLWRGPFRATALVFFAAIFLHLVLDTLAGGILWLWPFDTSLLSLVTIPPTRSNWVLSFVFHWTFLLEIAIWLVALVLWLSRGR